MGGMLRIPEAVNKGVDMENYPRAMFQASLELGEHHRERDQKQPQAIRQDTGLSPHDVERHERATEHATQQQQHGQEDTKAQRRRQFPEGPRPRRPNPDSPAYGGWDVLDSLTVEQCAVRTPGLQTIEYIPNLLQEEWTEAWNAVRMLWHAAVSEEEKERAMKWIMWLPQGLLHAPQRGANNGNIRYMELARRFVR